MQVATGQKQGFKWLVIKIITDNSCHSILDLLEMTDGVSLQRSHSCDRSGSHCGLVLHTDAAENRD